MGDLEQYEVRALRRDAEIDAREDAERFAREQCNRQKEFRGDGYRALVKIYPTPSNPTYMATVVHRVCVDGGGWQTVLYGSFGMEQAADEYDRTVVGYRLVIAEERAKFAPGDDEPIDPSLR